MSRHLEGLPPIDGFQSKVGIDQYRSFLKSKEMGIIQADPESESGPGGYGSYITMKLLLEGGKGRNELLNQLAQEYKIEQALAPSANDIASRIIRIEKTIENLLDAAVIREENGMLVLAMS